MLNEPLDESSGILLAKRAAKPEAISFETVVPAEVFYYTEDGLVAFFRPSWADAGRRCSCGFQKLEHRRIGRISLLQRIRFDLPAPTWHRRPAASKCVQAARPDPKRQRMQRRPMPTYSLHDSLG